jgi:hypothetical protein
LQPAVDDTADSLSSSTLPEKPASQLSTIFNLFLILRLIVLFFYTPQGLFNVYVDYNYYYRTALLSEQGKLPFINMWYEYPPVLAYLPQLAYWLTGTMVSPGGVDSIAYQVFLRVLGLLLLIFDGGVLLLIHDIGKRLWGMERANWLGWVYACLSLPLFFWSFSHQVVAVFFLLLSIWWFIRRRLNLSAAALGLGIAAKITPFFLLSPALRFTWPRRKEMLTYLGLTVITGAVVFIPFLASGGLPWIIASFAALSRVGSYGTIWAILDGNWGPGSYGELKNRLDILQAYQTHANPAVIPGWIVLIFFSVIYLMLLLRPMRVMGNRQFLWFTTLTALIFHLWSRGWSPQWSLMLIPLFLLSFPDRRGLGWTLALTGLIFLEWPFTVAFELNGISALFILLRTMLFILISIYIFRQLWPAGRDRIAPNV